MQELVLSLLTANNSPGSPRSNSEAEAAGFTSHEARPVTPRATPSSSSQMAGQAALSRLDPGPATSRPASASIKAQAKAELAQEQEQAASSADDMAYSRRTSSTVPKCGDNQSRLLVSSVHFWCRCSRRLKRAELESHLQECLLMQLAEDPPSAAATMVYTLNKDKEKVKVGVDTICKYLDNVCLHPTEEKYHKIRASNKAFQERVSPLVGAEEFLQAAGFERRILPHEESETDFFVLGEELARDTDRLFALKEVLKSGAPFRPTLDRDMRVYHPSRRAAHFELPDDFYSLKPEEIKREQQARTEAVERSMMLRTKAMREADTQKALRWYRYALIRVRFPDGILLQGTFHARDELGTLKEFIRSQLCNSWQPFILTDPGNTKLTNDDAMLAALNLAPAAVVNFSWDAAVMSDIAAAGQGAMRTTYLKPEAMRQLQPL